MVLRCYFPRGGPLCHVDWAARIANDLCNVVSLIIFTPRTGGGGRVTSVRCENSGEEHAALWGTPLQ